MIKQEELLLFFSEKGIDEDWSFKDTKPSERAKWSHGYHRYPAKFIPQLVEKLLEEYIEKNQTKVKVNDPFFGCGTTIVSAIANGYYASGTDINKIAYLITKVKSTPIEPQLLKNRVEDFLAKIKVITSKQTTLLDYQNKTNQTIIPEQHKERIDYWFKKDTQLILGKILKIINEEADNCIRDFLLVCFSHCLKNCSIWLMGSTKPTRDLKKKIPDIYSTFKRQLNVMVKGNENFFSSVPVAVRTNPEKYLNIKIGDARLQPVENNSVDIIITSSPYVTSYEYADLHQLSTIWLNLTEDLAKYKKEFIGTSYKKSEMEIQEETIAEDIVKKLQVKDKKLADNVQTYFTDMKQVFDESYRILKKGCRCCYVIGNTKLRGIEILNAEVFAELLQYSGFEFERLIKREIHSKLLPQSRDEKTGKFANNHNADSIVYPVEYIVIGLKR